MFVRYAPGLSKCLADFRCDGKYVIEHEKVISWLKEENGLKEGHFLLSSGLHSGKYIDKMALFRNPRNVKEIALDIAQQIDSYKFDTLVSCHGAGSAMLATVIGYQMWKNGKKNIRVVHADNNERAPLSIGDKLIVLVGDVVASGTTITKVASLIDKKIVCAVAGVSRGRTCKSFIYTNSGITDLYASSVVSIPSYTSSICPYCLNGKPIQIP